MIWLALGLAVYVAGWWFSTRSIYRMMQRYSESLETPLTRGFARRRRSEDAGYAAMMSISWPMSWPLHVLIVKFEDRDQKRGWGERLADRLEEE